MDKIAMRISLRAKTSVSRQENYGNIFKTNSCNFGIEANKAFERKV